MASFTDRIRGVRDDVVARRDEQVFANGFDTAANICVAAIQAQAEPLNQQLRDGHLDAEGQRLLTLIADLKNDVEERLRQYWEEQ